MRPNIFDIATKELNQDAFVTWLLQYADGRDTTTFTTDDRRVSRCGKQFIKILLAKANPELDTAIIKVDAGRQWESIDVWAEVDDKYLIIIEDKTNSGQHGDQLSRYKIIATEWCEKQSPAYEMPICIYLKTGNESLGSLAKVAEQGFTIFNRQHFLELLNSHTEIENQILEIFGTG